MHEVSITTALRLSDGKIPFCKLPQFFSFVYISPTARLQVSFFSLFPGKLKQVQVEGGEKEIGAFFRII